MQYCDILFPLNLGPLTYRCPAHLQDSLRPGMLVSAYLKKRLAHGIVFDVNASPPPGKVRELQAVIHETPALSQGMVRLIRWMSEYYIANEGIVLKQTVPAELFERIRERGTAKEVRISEHPALPPVSSNDLEGVTGAALSGHYSAILFFQPSMLHEYSLACETVQRLKNVIIILPEITQADLLFSMVRSRVGQRACILHSGIARGRRSAYIEGIISGKHDIVVGTRMALFSPMLKPSLVLLLQENSSSYKLEEGLQPHKVREVLLWGSENPNCRLDITGTFALKLAALRCHESQVGGHHAANVEEWVRQRAEAAAEGEQFALGEAFHREIIYW